MWPMRLSKLFFCNSCHTRALLPGTKVTSTVVRAFLKAPEERKSNWKMRFNYGSQFTIIMGTQSRKKPCNFERCGRERLSIYMIQIMSIYSIPFS